MGSQLLTGGVGAELEALYAARAVDSLTLLRRAARGQCNNVRFQELVALVESLGFELRRVSGSHHIYVHPDLDELVNLQEVGGRAKPYQVRQLVRIAFRYSLTPRRQP
ncbi:MAG TPA: type II toxin-antitoxin system HicA family toxin [Candidatus Dormibacteraeota bacterium]